MTKKERQAYILECVKSNGKITTNELVKRFECTEDTIRKDFQELSAKGLVQRFHGGVQQSEKKGVILYEERSVTQTAVKERLAQATVPFLLDKHVLYIDGGSTNQKIVEALPRDFAATIVTNAIPIAAKLCEFPNVEAIMLGGSLNKAIRNTEGSLPISQLSLLNFDCYVIGVSSISLTNGITYPLLSEAQLKQDALSRSKEIITAVSKEKLNTIAGFYAADASAITRMITDEDDPAILEPYKEIGLTVITI
ncbi:MAG: DeoR/GlpR family DNA-binding transcription regulator [Lachnospiraceae bacterium]